MSRSWYRPRQRERSRQLPPHRFPPPAEDKGAEPFNALDAQSDAEVEGVWRLLDETSEDWDVDWDDVIYDDKEEEETFIASLPQNRDWYDRNNPAD